MCLPGRVPGQHAQRQTCRPLASSSRTLPSRAGSQAGEVCPCQPPGPQPSNSEWGALPGHPQWPPWAQVTRAGLGLPETCPRHFCDCSWTGEKPSVDVLRFWERPEPPGQPPTPCARVVRSLLKSICPACVEPPRTGGGGPSLLHRIDGAVAFFGSWCSTHSAWKVPGVPCEAHPQPLQKPRIRLSLYFISSQQHQFFPWNIFHVYDAMISEYHPLPETS